MLSKLAARIAWAARAFFARRRLSVLLPLAAVLPEWWIRSVTKHTSYQLFLAAVALSALTGGTGSGFIALALSAAAGLSLSLGPGATDTADALPFVLFVSLGMVIAWVAGDARAARNKLAEALRGLTRENEVQAQRRHSREMRELGRFAAGLARDMNNLLTLVQGYGDLLRSRLAGSGRRSLEEPVEEILRASERGARLTSRLLAFSRRQASPDTYEGPTALAAESASSPGPDWPAPSAPPLPSPGTGSILVAEEDEGIRKLVCSLLRADHYVVLEAKDGAEALRIASRNVNSIALVIADETLPVLSVARLLDRLWILRPDIRVLYTSADGEPGWLDTGRRAVRFLPKPFGATAFRAVVDSMLGRQHLPA